MDIISHIPGKTISQNRDLRYEISSLLALGGIKSPIYFPERIGVKPDSSIHYGIDSIAEELNQSTLTSWMGTPIWMPLTLKGKTYKNFDSQTGELKDVEYADFVMPPTILIDFTRAKNIVKTQVSGGIGSVKELYSFDDWQINIRGFLLDDKGGSTAKEKSNTLLNWERIAGSISIVCDLFNDRFIADMVISSLTTKQVEGRPNVVEFNISAESDTAYELKFI